MSKGLLKITHKPHVLIRDYGFREAIKLKNLIKIKINDSKDICGLDTRNEVDNLVNMVKNTINIESCFFRYVEAQT
jgi:hypothetical protein